jgi:hypothetical protein
VEFFTKARGDAQQVKALYHTYFCTYDDKGNLFVDGFNNAGQRALIEFFKGQSTFTPLALEADAGWIGGLAWNGQNLLMEDPIANKFEPSRPTNAIYVLTIVSNAATLDQVMPLEGALDVVDFALRGKTVIAPDVTNENVGYYSYPQGGNPTKTLRTSTSRWGWH